MSHKAGNKTQYITNLNQLQLVLFFNVHNLCLAQLCNSFQGQPKCSNQSDFDMGWDKSMHRETPTKIGTDAGVWSHMLWES